MSYFADTSDVVGFMFTVYRIGGLCWTYNLSLYPPFYSICLSLDGYMYNGSSKRRNIKTENGGLINLQSIHISTRFSS